MRHTVQRGQDLRDHPGQPSPVQSVLQQGNYGLERKSSFSKVRWPVGAELKQEPTLVDSWSEVFSLRPGYSMGWEEAEDDHPDEAEPTAARPGRMEVLVASLVLCGSVAMGKPSHWAFVPPSRGVGLV